MFCGTFFTENFDVRTMLRRKTIEAQFVIGVWDIEPSLL